MNIQDKAESRNTNRKCGFVLQHVFIIIFRTLQAFRVMERWTDLGSDQVGFLIYSSLSWGMQMYVSMKDAFLAYWLSSSKSSLRQQRWCSASSCSSNHRGSLGVHIQMRNRQEQRCCCWSRWFTEAGSTPLPLHHQVQAACLKLLDVMMLRSAQSASNSSSSCCLR